MQLVKKIVFLVLIVFSLSFCVSKQNVQSDFPQEIAAVYFQNHSAQENQVLAGTDFYIELVKPLQEGIILEKVYFQNQEAQIKILNTKTFTAHFYPVIANQDLVMHSNPLKEYGNKPPIVSKPKFNLEPTQAILEYRIKARTFYYKITGVKEKPIIVYPSTNKPKN